jgi:hypothetical protein
VADEADIANDQVQKALDATMRTINTVVPTNDTNECIWCGEPIKEKDERRWCSVVCRDEHVSTYKL